ncbi:MAG: TrkA family potassium uptake protein [Eubacterium sp.]|nr:TrkA family potassium uptake protein [Eubacterium sp.]
MKEKTYAILGLGGYGMKLAEAVRKTGAETIVADSDSVIIEKNAHRFTYAVSLDMRNIDALSEIGLENADIAVVDRVGNLEESIMCVIAAKNAGISSIIATAPNSTTKDILIKMGATEVVIPEEEAALRMARTLISEDFMEYIDIGEGLCVIRIFPLKPWIGKRIKDLQLRKTYNANIIAIMGEEGMTCRFQTDTVLTKDTAMYISINKKDVMNFVS